MGLSDRDRLAERHWNLFSVILQEYDYEAAKAEAKRAYFAGFDAASAEAAPLVEALERIAAGLVAEGDCVACDFGPLQSAEHAQDCPFFVAREALAKYGKAP